MRKTALLLLIMLLAFGGFVQAQEDTTTCEEGLRAFEDSVGTVCVPEDVERVVALEWKYIEDLLALGIQPVGAADIENYEVWVDVPQELEDDVVDVGTRQEPNLERIAELEPELIITTTSRAANNYDELMAIAPVLAFNPYPDDMAHYDEMISTLRVIADAVNKQDEAEAVIAEVEAYFAAAQTALEEAGHAGETFILAQGWVSNEVSTFRLFTDNAMAVQIMEQIGLENAWDDAPQLYGFTEVTFEGFAEIEDTNFFYVAQDDANEVFADSPLWNGLPFVQSGRAYWLGGDVWLFGGPYSALLLVDTFLQAMGVEPPQVGGTTEETTSEGETRAYDHVFGTTEIPADPQQIIAADLGAFIPTIGTLAALDVDPVLVTASQIPDYLADYTGDVEIISGQFSYEALLQYNPDLIITPGVAYNEENYDNLSLIAPAVAPEWYWQTLEEVTGYWREIGVLVNKADEAEQLITDLQARIDTLSEELAPQMEGKTVSVFQVQGAGLAALYLQTGRLESALLDAIGIERPENQTYDPNAEAWYVTLSPELINEVDAWAIFVELYAEDPADISAIREELEANPLWQSLEAVQNDRVFYVETETWSGTDPFVANLILNTIETNLTAALSAE